MEKLMTLGIAITAIDKATKPLQEVHRKLSTVYTDATKLSKVELTRGIDALESKIAKLNSLKLKLNDRLKRGDANAEVLRSTVARIDRQLESLNRKKLTLTDRLKQAKGAAQELDGIMQRFGMNMSKYGAFLAAGGTMLTNRLMQSVTAFKEVQKAQGDIASLGIGVEGIEKITRAAKEMSRQYAGVTMPEFIKASYDIKSGIASLSDEGVAQFTKFAALAARATKSSTEEMTKLFALGYGIFKRADESDMRFGERFSASIAKAVQAFRTDGSDLVQGLSNIGAVAKANGVSLAEELAVIGNAKGAFSTAAEAGTAYRAFLSSAVQAQEKLGASLVDTQGKLLPMRMVLEQLKKRFGDTLDSIEMKQIKDAFGSEEAVKIITALIDKTDALRESEQELVRARLSDAEAMAKARNKGSEFALMMQRLSLVSIAVGKTLSPIFNKVAAWIGTIAQKVERFINTPLGKWLTYVALAAAALATVLGVVGLAVGAFILYVGAAGKALALFSYASKLAAFGAALMQAAMSPIVLTVAAIAAAVYLMIDNWSMLSGWFASLWSGIVSLFASASDFITRLITDPVGTISEAWSMLSGWFGDFWEKLKSLFASGAKYVADIFTDPIGWIKSMWAKLLNWLGEKIDAIKGIVNAVSNFVVGKDVFTIKNLNGKGGGDNASKYKTSENKGGGNKSIIEPLSHIAKQTKPLLDLKIPQIGNLPRKSLGKAARLASARAPKSYAQSARDRIRDYGNRGGGNKTYNINIRVLANGNEEIAQKLESLLPPLIKDIEHGVLAGGFGDVM